MDAYRVRKVLTDTQLRAGGTTLVGLTVAQALDEALEDSREHKVRLDPTTISIKTDQIGLLGEMSLSIEVEVESEQPEGA